MLDVVVSMFSPAAGVGNGALAPKEQEDAQEFLTFLLDGAHSEILKLRKLVSGTAPRSPSLSSS